MQTVASVLRAAPSAKAAGRDGWTYADLKRLPRTALVLLCDIFQSTERTGKWPEPIAHSFVAMLPNGGVWRSGRLPACGLAERFLQALGQVPRA